MTQIDLSFTARSAAASPDLTGLDRQELAAALVESGLVDVLLNIPSRKE